MPRAVRARARQAMICFDPFHGVKLATEALDTVRRQAWSAARRLRDQSIAKKFKGARWVVLKNPLDLTDNQHSTLRETKRSGGVLWRAYQLKESLRAVFAGDLDPTDMKTMPARWCSKAQRSRIPEFVTAPRTIRKHQDGTNAAPARGLSNRRQEGLNNKVRLTIHRAYGFHSTQAALAAVMLACGPVNLTLPYHTPLIHM